MTMPIQFDQIQYIKTLTDAGLPPGQAAAHATALTQALSQQPVATDADMIVQRAELRALLEEMEIRLEARLLAKMKVMMEEMLEEMLEAKLEAKLSKKLRPIYAMGSVIVIMLTITMTKLFL